MILYHGSNMDIVKIDLSKSKVGKDFGCGFYLSADKEQALELAERKTEQLGEGIPKLNVYEFDETYLRAVDLNVLCFREYSKEWAEFVLRNRDRKGKHPVHGYDIVIGPIADDGVTYQLRRYSEGDISMRRLVEELKYAKGLTIQYFFGTERALSYLRKL